VEVPRVTEPEAQDDTPKLPLTVESPIAWAEEFIAHDALKAYYKEHGIRCFACCAAVAETFAQGAKVHEGGPHGAFDAAKVVADLNDLAARHPLTEAPESKGLLRKLIDLFF